MPKIAKTNAEWRKVIREHARGTFKFSTGEKPRPGTYGYTELNKLQKCPLYSNPGAKDLTGKRINCVCGYHAINPQTVSINSYKLAFAICISLCSTNYTPNLLPPLLLPPHLLPPNLLPPNLPLLPSLLLLPSFLLVPPL